MGGGGAEEPEVEGLTWGMGAGYGRLDIVGASLTLY